MAPKLDDHHDSHQAPLWSIDMISRSPACPGPHRIGPWSFTGALLRSSEISVQPAWGHTPPQLLKFRLGPRTLLSRCRRAHAGSKISRCVISSFRVRPDCCRLRRSITHCARFTTVRALARETKRASPLATTTAFIQNTASDAWFAGTQVQLGSIPSAAQ